MLNVDLPSLGLELAYRHFEGTLFSGYHFGFGTQYHVNDRSHVGLSYLDV